MSDFTLHVDRSSFAGMLGDCYELVAHAAAGQVPDVINHEMAQVESWRDGNKDECINLATEAATIMAFQGIKLCAHGNAVDEVVGINWCKGFKFARYGEAHDRHELSLMGDFEARKLACDVELGLS